jgi:predicted NAD/FAD-binding protein
MKVAIVGAGIAGNTAAYRLRTEHEVTVFEAADYVGGHTHTVDVEHAGERYAVDTGFIVFNDWTYPNFVALLAELGVATQPTSMSFSVSCERTGLEYNGTSLAALFADRRNLLRPRFYRLLADIVRFGRDAQAFLASGDDAVTLAEFLAARGYSRELVESYVVPMTAAIWSAAPSSVSTMPARFLFRFFANHGMLSIDDRPQWRTVCGGSARYVERLVAGHEAHIRTRCAVTAITRRPQGVVVRTRAAEPELFDAVFLACHSDQALALLTDASTLEREVLGAIRYRGNDAVLHTDERLLPRCRRAWASWNYRARAGADRAPPLVTYHMNTLQRLTAPVELCVTLNDGGRVAPERVLGRYRYDHPVFDAAAVAAQARHAEIDGVRGTYFCGAYWRNGFHEDGVVSALAAVERFNARVRHAELDLRRAG